jgi:hypothetical protein
MGDILSCLTCETALAHLHESSSVWVVTPQSVGTVKDRFGSLSQMIVPSVSLLMYLYWKLVPAAIETVTVQSGFELVYDPAFRATALLGFQLPSAAIDPTTRIDSPKLVVTSSSKMTATVVGVAHGLLALVVVVPGQFVFVAGLNGPVAEVGEQTEGISLADGSPQDAGTMAFLREAAVKSAT